MVNYSWLLYLKDIIALPPHAIVMRLRGRDASYVVIIIPATADLLGL